MACYGEQVLDQLERFVSETEARTSAELVLVLAHRSGRYPDVPFKVASLVAYLALMALVLLPIEFHPGWMLAEVLVAFGLGYAAARGSHRAARWLTSSKRRAAEVRRSALAAFAQRGVHLTRERTGVLLYVSWLERRVELLVDVGVERHVPQDVFNAAKRELSARDLFERFPQRLPTAFSPLADLLARCLPSRPDDPDEIPNRPVVIE